MLEVGVTGAAGQAALTPEEQRTHLGMWAVMAAPLIAGNDVRSADPATLALLTTRDVLAVDQDPLGRQGRRVRDGDRQVWAKPLTGGRLAVALYNRGETAAPIATTARELHLPPAARYLVRDAWSGRQWVTTGGLDAQVRPHDTALLLVQPQP
jgi:alpha-galactosidase